MTRSFIMSNWLNSKCSCILRCKRANVVGSQFWSTLCKRHYRELVASNLAASYCKMGCWFCGWAYLSVEEFESASRIILATDGDAPGQALAEELSRRLGKERLALMNVDVDPTYDWK
ncbi:putative DNA helicase [Helianthus anomalus]